MLIELLEGIHPREVYFEEFYTYIKGVPFHTNPSLQELNELAKELERGVKHITHTPIRFIADKIGKRVYVWIGERFTHDMAAKSLKLSNYKRGEKYSAEYLSGTLEHKGTKWVYSESEQFNYEFGQLENSILGKEEYSERLQYLGTILEDIEDGDWNWLKSYFDIKPYVEMMKLKYNLIQKLINKEI
jgi:hypothetical protein